MQRLFGNFLEDTRGAILIFWALALVVIIGLVALSFDIGRIASTHAELQSFADQVALAAAGELDGSSDALTRATNAADTMISGSQTFGNGSQKLFGSTDFSLAFYATLPANDTSSLGAATTDPTKAQYVAVTAAPRSIGLTFAAVLYSLLGQPVPKAITQASAVAGFTQYACDITPMMMCVPPPTNGKPYSADGHIGDMVLLRAGGSSAWAPGDFGFLDPTATGIAVDPTGPCTNSNGKVLTGAPLMECLLAAEGNISQCFSQRGVTTSPGQQTGIQNAVMNVRFDIYQSTLGNESSNPAYRPAPNVIKGDVTDSSTQNTSSPHCNSSPTTSTDTIPLPLDQTWEYGGRFGIGDWDPTTYIAKNWNGVLPNGDTTWNGTRYDLYRMETLSTQGQPTILPSAKSETGRPVCQAASPNLQRRVIVVAGIDCSNIVINGKTSNVPVQEFFKMFLVRPVGADPSDPTKQDIFAEIIGSGRGDGGAAGKGGLFHDVSQLYR